MATPVFQDETLTLYQGNMKDIISSIEFNYIVTDPPYNCKYKYPDYKDNMPQDKYIELLCELQASPAVVIHYPEAFCNEIGQALGVPQKMVAWVYNSNLGRQHRSIGWFGCKPNLNLVKQPYKNPNDKRVKKLIEEGSEGRGLYDWWEINLIKNVSKEKSKLFTNQIPIEVLERIILTTTEPGDVILDPFFGSGSIYFACKNTNRRCIGIELSGEHIEAFYDRLSKE
jgi:DNA modification methylase